MSTTVRKTEPMWPRTYPEQDELRGLRETIQNNARVKPSSVTGPAELQLILSPTASRPYGQQLLREICCCKKLQDRNDTART